MRTRLHVLGLAFGLGLFAPPALAQDADEAEMVEATDDEMPSDAAPAETAVDDGPEPFEIRRGLFVRGDFGVYFALGGSDVDRNTTPPIVTDNSASSLQPMIGATIGYDLLTTNKVNLSAGLRLSYFFIAGASQVPTDPLEQAVIDTSSYPADYEVAQAGAAVDVTYMLTERFGLLFHGDGGIGIMSPDPDLPATTAPAQGGENDPGFFTEGAGDPVIGGVFSGALGVEYNTKLTGFSIGFQAAFIGALSSESFIPGLGFYIPLKYNF